MSTAPAGSQRLTLPMTVVKGAAQMMSHIKQPPALVLHLALQYTARPAGLRAAFSAEHELDRAEERRAHHGADWIIDEGSKTAVPFINLGML